MLLKTSVQSCSKYGLVVQYHFSMSDISELVSSLAARTVGCSILTYSICAISELVSNPAASTGWLFKKPSDSHDRFLDADSVMNIFQITDEVLFLYTFLNITLSYCHTCL